MLVLNLARFRPGPMTFCKRRQSGEARRGASAVLQTLQPAFSMTVYAARGILLTDLHALESRF